MNGPLLLSLIFAWVAGIGLGVLFFGGLWLTVRRLPECHRPALLFAASFVGRMLLAVGAFYFVIDGRWERGLACLAGFVMARAALVRLALPDHPPKVSPAGESASSWTSPPT